jgi:hypothetical protein
MFIFSYLRKTDWFSKNMTVFCDVTRYNAVVHRRFAITYCLHFQGRRVGEESYQQHIGYVLLGSFLDSESGRRKFI